MKQKQFFSLLLCSVFISGLAAGCQKTPDKPIVREKGAQSIENYKEAAPAPASKSNALSERLQVPEKYEASQTGNDGSYQLSCNAEIFVPDVDKISIYKVVPKPFDQEWINTVTNAFFGDAAIYDGDAYFQMTKAEAQKQLNQLKSWQAEGNLDPFGLIASARESGLENPEEAYSLAEDIASWEETYNNAPETAEKIEISPAFGVQPQYADFGGGYFTGAVELQDGVYSYRLRETQSCPMDIRICRSESSDPAMITEWSSTMYGSGDSPSNPSAPSREEAEKMAGITPEQAIEITDGYMKKLGLENFSPKTTALSLKSDSGNSLMPTTAVTFPDAGYMVSYTRDVDGFPVTDEMDMGGGQESMESTLETWAYERIEFYVNKDGLQRADIFNLYEIGEEQVSNVELLSFPEIAETFEEMASIRFSEYTAPESIKVNVSDVRLGYMRIYDPGADSRCGLLAPVWDFFGVKDIHSVYNGEANDYAIDYPRGSIFTINAADGTVIDRELGY